MERSKLYRLLKYPLVYSMSQKMLAPGSDLLLKRRYKDILRKSKGLVLDVGCGPLLTTPLPNGTIIGVDINLLYVKKYAGVDLDKNPNGIRQCPGQRTRFGVVCNADSLPFDENTFDETRSLGLLHHLPHGTAVSAIREMSRCTRRNGKIIIFDNVWPRIPLRRPVAWLTRRLDRGAWIRTESELARLARVAYPGKWVKKRFTYTVTGLEGLVLSVSKREG